MELFKILKHHSPISLFDLLKVSNRGAIAMLLLPRVNLDTSKHSFVFNSSKLWNKYKNLVFNKCTPLDNGILIPGSTSNSDLAASTSIVKCKFKSVLLASQKSGDDTEW